MSAFWLKVAAFSGASAVLLGAFGAHGLKNRAGIDAAQLKTWETAAHYHLVHSAALLFAAYTRSRPAALLFTAGEGRAGTRSSLCCAPVIAHLTS